MSEAIGYCNLGGCVKTDRKDNIYRLTDTKYPAIGPLVVLSAVEYKGRLKDVQATGDATKMFDDHERPVSLTDGELAAFALYAMHDINPLDPDKIEDGASVTAYVDRRDLDFDNLAGKNQLPFTD